MRALSTVPVVLLATGLAGCSHHAPLAAPSSPAGVAATSSSDPSNLPAAGDSTASAAGTVTASHAPVRSTATDRPTEPAGGTRPVPTGAAAFVTYYFQAVDHAFRTGDTEPLRRASTATNQTTTDLISRAAAMHQQGSTPLGTTQRVTVTGSAASTVPAGAAPAVEVTARYSSPAVVVVDKDHHTASAPAVAERTITVTVLWLAGHWRVDAVHDPAATTPGG